MYKLVNTKPNGFRVEMFLINDLEMEEDDDLWSIHERVNRITSQRWADALKKEVTKCIEDFSKKK